MFDDLIRRMLIAGGNRKAACFVYAVAKGLDYGPSVIKMAKLTQEHYDHLSEESGYALWMRHFIWKVQHEPYKDAPLMAAVLSNLMSKDKVIDTAVAFATRAYVTGAHAGVVYNREDEIIRQMLILADLFDPELTIDAKPICHPDSGQLSCLRTNFKFPTHKPLDRGVLLANEKAACHIAMQAYNEEDWEKLPILADALEDAGCPDQQLLDHLRIAKGHVRGCWALDHIFQTMKPDILT